MRILVVGAGAIGGYFGGRLLAAGRDVTFLVRAKRAAALKRTGLSIRSPAGNLDLPEPPTVAAEALRAPFDLILLSCKAYDLEGAIESFAPAVGPETAILPLLNGMRQLDILDRRFGEGHALGGLCLISASLDPEGRILHLNELHGLTYGERDGARSPRVEAIAAAFAGAHFDARLSETIVQEMWEKWVFIATAAGLTCLMRASIGDIVAAGASGLALALFDECADIARRQGHAPSGPVTERIRAMITAKGSATTASMLRDIENGAPVEADHIIGDLMRRGEIAQGASLLAIAYAHLKAYEARRARGQAPAKLS
ncbi:2-dehydropantoate 2-reductase [Methylocapsa sp. S129]|uniref:2-dehydropantoate 2-reductase n=1 Tax=Methylocapsa sp. S129 TaxID=1641869 RepID=UPI00131CFF83|nr:2-dehydropantoate 2-reductase [Methylocapsa sp. S129]